MAVEVRDAEMGRLQDRDEFGAPTRFKRGLGPTACVPGLLFLLVLLRRWLPLEPICPAEQERQEIIDIDFDVTP
ncbi:hypothetical protein HYQ44_005319 [Verticillium longisporum]|nr:hypothetical protein HYQ44_005319 [Verticillium longisporum]